MTQRRQRPEVHVARSSLAIGIELRPSSSIEPRATSSPMKHDSDSSPLIPENYPDDDEDLALLALRSLGSHFFIYLFFLLCAFLGDFTVSVNFFFFSSSTCACVWLLRKCGKKMGIWILKNLLKYGNVQYLLILI